MIEPSRCTASGKQRCLLAISCREQLDHFGRDDLAVEIDDGEMQLLAQHARQVGFGHEVQPDQSDAERLSPLLLIAEGCVQLELVDQPRLQQHVA